MAKKKAETPTSNDPLAMLISGEPETNGVVEFPDGFLTMTTNPRWFGSWAVHKEQTVTGKEYQIDRYGGCKVDTRDVDTLLAIKARVFCTRTEEYLEVSAVFLSR